MRWLLLYNLPQGCYYIHHIQFWKKTVYKKGLTQKMEFIVKPVNQANSPPNLLQEWWPFSAHVV